MKANFPIAFTNAKTKSGIMVTVQLNFHEFGDYGSFGGGGYSSLASALLN